LNQEFWKAAVKRDPALNRVTVKWTAKWSKMKWWWWWYSDWYTILIFEIWYSCPVFEMRLDQRIRCSPIPWLSDVHLFWVFETMKLNYS
jgi:hypothetical protein